MRAGRPSRSASRLPLAFELIGSFTEVTLVHYPDLFREELDLAVVVSGHGIGRIKLGLKRIKLGAQGIDYDDQGFLVEGIQLFRGKFCHEKLLNSAE